MIIGLVICHGDLAFAYLKAAEQIIGKSEKIYAFTNDMLSPTALSQKIQAALQGNNNDNILALVDLMGGSCWMAANLLSRQFPRIRVISGVNLPMLISFLIKREKYLFEELLAIIEEDGHKAITLT